MSDTEHMSQQEILKAENDRYYAFVNLALILAAVTGIELVLVYLPFLRKFLVDKHYFCTRSLFD